jgi:hypothetical protein
LLDRDQKFGVVRRYDGEGRAATAGPAGPANAVNIVFSVQRYVEIEHVTDQWNVQAARSNI